MFVIGCAGPGASGPQKAWNQGIADLRAGRHARAAATFGQILERVPHNVPARYNLACALVLGGDLEAARGQLEQAVRSGFSDPELLDGDPDLAPLRGAPGWHDLLAVARGVRAEQNRRSLRLRPSTAGERSGLLVYLHGHLDNPENGLRSLRLAAERLGFALLVPSGGQVFRLADGKPGFGWLGSDVSRVADQIRAEFELGQIDPQRVYLVGFSAGAAMAYQIGLGRKDLARGVVAMAGYLPGFAEGQSPIPLPVVILHGDGDKGAPPSEGRRAAKILDSASVPVLQRTYVGEHHFPPGFEQVLVDALAWIDRQAAGP